MKTLFINGEELQAERIVKTDTDIIGYNNDSDTPVWSFKGISDFTLFQLAEGQEWDISDEEQWEAIIAVLSYELIQKDLTIQTLEGTQADLIYSLMIGGVL